jgi:hypothetical protein
MGTSGSLISPLGAASRLHPSADAAATVHPRLHLMPGSVAQTLDSRRRLVESGRAMMHAWSFAARTAEEVGRLVRALGRHRYLREADLRLHFTVDRALGGLAEPLLGSDGPLDFAAHAAAFAARRRREPDLDPRSRDPSLWRPATLDEVVAALTTFWTPDAAGMEARERLLDALEEHDLLDDDRDPFASSPEEPPHPELVILDWVLLPVDELDAERHAGALAALEQSGEEIDPSAPIFQEATVLAASELVLGAPSGVLADDFLVWSEGPYPYADYVFRGASKAAKLVEPPVGYRDL